MAELKWNNKIEDDITLWEAGPFIIEQIGPPNKRKYRCYVMEYQVGQPESTLKGAMQWCEQIATECKDVLSA